MAKFRIRYSVENQEGWEIVYAMNSDQAIRRFRLFRPDAPILEVLKI